MWVPTHTARPRPPKPPQLEVTELLIHNSRTTPFRPRHLQRIRGRQRSPAAGAGSSSAPPAPWRGDTGAELLPGRRGHTEPREGNGSAEQAAQNEAQRTAAHRSTQPEHRPFPSRRLSSRTRRTRPPPPGALPAPRRPGGPGAARPQARPHSSPPHTCTSPSLSGREAAAAATASLPTMPRVLRGAERSGAAGGARCCHGAAPPRPNGRRLTDAGRKARAGRNSDLRAEGGGATVAHVTHPLRQSPSAFCCHVSPARGRPLRPHPRGSGHVPGEAAPATAVRRRRAGFGAAARGAAAA